MCIVIDLNVFAPVFNPQHLEHSEYIHVNHWITKGKGFIVFGGTHYLKELKAISRYLSFITELSRRGRVRKLVDELVDKEEQQVEALLKGSACDDCHLIAILRTSGCRLICSNDKRADKYLKDRRCYLPGQKVPQIYRRRAHKHLLCDRNIRDIQNLA